MNPPIAGRENSPRAVEIQGLSHRYGDHLAVDGLDLLVAAGECFGLLGPNGAGKTTTIRILNTLLPVQRGLVTVFGRDVRREAMAVRRLLGYVPQQLSIEGALTGRENVAWFARLFDVPRRERASRVAEVLALVELTDAADRLAATFSGGMVRRLELAQALVNRPMLLVLDEPTVGLDPIARDSVWTRLRLMQEQYGMTVLLTTHYMEEAEALCDRVALMHRGQLRALGSPDDLKAQLRPDATLEDVFRHYTGEHLRDEPGGLRDVRSTRRTARRVG
jgi:ABC-2 type transport system ATP-binding protein